RNQDINRLKVFTNQLLESVRGTDEILDRSIQNNEPQIGTTETGTIRFYNDRKEFGVLERDNGGDIYVHRRGLLNVPWQQRITGTRVEFDVVRGTEDRPKADEVRLADGSIS